MAHLEKGLQVLLLSEVSFFFLFKLFFYKLAAYIRPFGSLPLYMRKKNFKDRCKRVVNQVALDLGRQLRCLPSVF